MAILDIRWPTKQKILAKNKNYLCDSNLRPHVIKPRNPQHAKPFSHLPLLSCDYCRISRGGPAVIEPLSTRSSCLFDSKHPISSYYGHRRSDHPRQLRVSEHFHLHPIVPPNKPPNTPSSRPIIQSGFRSSSPAYPLLHIDALNNTLVKSSRAGDVDPVIYVPTYDGRDALLPSACCHILCGDIRIMCPVSGDGEFGLWWLNVCERLN